MKVIVKTAAWFEVSVLGTSHILCLSQMVSREPAFGKRSQNVLSLCSHLKFQLLLLCLHFLTPSEVRKTGTVQLALCQLASCSLDWEILTVDFF